MTLESGTGARRARLATLRIERAARAKHGRLRRWIVPVGLPVAAMLAVLGHVATQPKAQQRVSVPIPIAPTPSLPRTLDASGYVAARRRATIAAPVTGTLVALPVEVGMTVERGQLLAKLDDRDVRAQWNLALAEVRAARSAQRETEVRLEEARAEHARRVLLAGAGVVNRVSQAIARVEMGAQRARLDHQRDQVRVARRRADYWCEQVERRSIRAPFSGIVVSRDAEIGETVAPVAEPGRFARVGLLTLVDMKSLGVEVDVTERQIHRVRTGQAVEVVLDAYPDVHFAARVDAVVPAADRRRATVRVHVALSAADPRVWPEMGARVSFLEPQGHGEAAGEEAGGAR